MTVMNIFRIAGDLTHLASFVILLMKLRQTRSAIGVSLKTQELYCLVFITRYSDLFSSFAYPYNTFMKIIYISLSFYIVYLIRFKVPYKSTYDETKDEYSHWKFAVLPCAVLALLINHKFTPFEVVWTFSIYLEAIAILPQLFMLSKFGEVENITRHYVFALGAYRALYILNWIYRYFTEAYYSQWIVWIAGLVQTGLYADFFYNYITSKGKAALPTQQKY